MELSNILNMETGRLFIIDPECFLIFTGDSKHDEKPFIRIGNCSGIPSRVIPLIENIIITDSTMGDPLVEPGNSDPEHIRDSRYIGSTTALEKFIPLQEKLGLHIDSSRIIKIEKDIPELTTEQDIFHGSRFIGVFYHDGNFKIEYNDRTIFELRAVQGRISNFNRIHDQLEKNSVSSVRYRGSGIVVMGHAPFIYHNHGFTALRMPDEYPNHFLALGINPDRIEAIMLRDEAPKNISSLLRWKGLRGSRLTVYGDSAGSIAPLAQYYSADAACHSWNRISYVSQRGAAVSNYHNSYSLSFTFGPEKPSHEPLKIALIADVNEIMHILKDNPDAVCIDYSLYEQTNLLFKSTDIPVLVIDDGNPNIRKLRGMSQVVLENGFQYNFKKALSVDEVLESIPGGREIHDVLLNGEYDSASDLLDLLHADQSSHERDPDIFNIRTVIRMIQNTTIDRSLALRLNRIYLECTQGIDPESLNRQGSEIIIELIFLNRSVYEVMRRRLHDQGATSVDISYPGLPESETENIPLYNDRIFHDRVRLNELLDLLFKARASSGPARDRERPASAGPDTGSVSMENAGARNNESGAGMPPEETRINKNSTHPAVKPGIAAGAAIIITAAVLIFLGHGRHARTVPPAPGKNKTVSDTVTENFRTQDVTVTDTEIYRYANMVAEKNGYRKLSFSKFKVKNPHWIYPGNEFIMLDGEKITVRPGDTLWKLSERKLRQIKK